MTKLPTLNWPYTTGIGKPCSTRFSFDEYKKEGLIPKKFKTAEELRGYLQRRLYAEMDGIIKSDPSIKGDKGFKKKPISKKEKKRY